MKLEGNTGEVCKKKLKKILLALIFIDYFFNIIVWVINIKILPKKDIKIKYLRYVLIELELFQFILTK